jgi:hypothetical protein
VDRVWSADQVRRRRRSDFRRRFAGLGFRAASLSMNQEGSTAIITGALGSGKTLAGADFGMNHLSYGGTVITNMPMYRDKLRTWMDEEFGLVMDDDRLRLLGRTSISNFHNLAMRGSEGNTVMMILDEAALDVGARDWAKHSDEQFNFVVLCRKLCIDLVLIAQDSVDVDKRIRGKMQREIHCRSLMKFWDGVKIPIFIRVPYTLEVGKKPWRRRPTWHWKAQSWGYFDSHGLHGEKAEIFGALEQAKSAPLQRKKYDPLPYYLALGSSAITSTATCLLGN